MTNHIRIKATINRRAAWKYLLFISCVSAPLCARAEQYLIQRNAEYLGWQISKELFKTCDKTLIRIGGGRIRVAREKCHGRLPPALQEITGTFLNADPKNQTITLRVDAKTQNALANSTSPQFAKLLHKDGKVRIFVSRGAPKELVINHEHKTAKLETLEKGYAVTIRLTPEATAGYVYFNQPTP